MLCDQFPWLRVTTHVRRGGKVGDRNGGRLSCLEFLSLNSVIFKF